MAVLGLQITIVTFLILFGVANGMAVAVLFFRKKLRTMSNMYIAALIIADFSLTSAMTVHYIDSIGFTTGLFLTSSSCAISTYLELSFLAASTTCVFLIALDVHDAVVLRSEYEQDVKKAFKRIAISWAVSFVYGLRILIQFLLPTSDKTSNDDDDELDEKINATSAVQNGLLNFSATIIHGELPEVPKFCNVIVEDDTEDLYYRIVDFVILFLVPLVLLCVLMVRVKRQIADQSLGEITRQRMRKSVKVRFVAGIIIFFLCWAPFYFFDIIQDSLEIMEEEEDDDEEDNDVGYYFRIGINVLANFQCIMNLVLYAWMNKNFREEVLRAARTVKRKMQSEVTPLNESQRTTT